jgi:hypothetical protein
MPSYIAVLFYLIKYLLLTTYQCILNIFCRSLSLPPPLWLSSIQLGTSVIVFYYNGGLIFSRFCTDPDDLLIESMDPHVKYNTTSCDTDQCYPAFSQPVCTDPLVYPDLEFDRPVCRVCADNPLGNIACLENCYSPELYDVKQRNFLARYGFTVDMCAHLNAYCSNYVDLLYHYNTCTTNKCSMCSTLYSLFITIIHSSIGFQPNP